MWCYTLFKSYNFLFYNDIYDYMSLKKIIREALDDMQWLKDIGPFDLNNTMWIIYLDEPYTDKESRKLQQFLYENGFEWPKNRQIEEMLRFRSVYYFNIDDHIFDGYDDWCGVLSRAVENGHRELIKWSDIKQSLNLNESEDNDFKWIMDISDSPEDLVLNKAFEFKPIAENGDKDYEKLNDYLVKLGFKPVYATPSKVNIGEKVSGIYAYRNGENKLKFVYTPDLVNENYKEHIIDFAKDYSIDGGDNLSVIDAREFINSI